MKRFCLFNDEKDNLQARRIFTQLGVIERILKVLIIFLSISIILKSSLNIFSKTILKAYPSFGLNWRKIEDRPPHEKTGD